MDVQRNADIIKAIHPPPNSENITTIWRRRHEVIPPHLQHLTVAQGFNPAPTIID